MRLLVDENLSIRVAEQLREAGHDVVHVIEVGLGNTEDQTIFAYAADHDRVIVTADADFGTLLGASSSCSIRPRVEPARSACWAGVRWSEERSINTEGRLPPRRAVASVTPERIRIRTLPMTGE